MKYEDYKRFGSNVKITYEGQGSSEGDQKDQKKPPTRRRNKPSAFSRQPSANVNTKTLASFGMTLQACIQCAS